MQIPLGVGETLQLKFCCVLLQLDMPSQNFEMDYIDRVVIKKKKDQGRIIDLGSENWFTGRNQPGQCRKVEKKECLQ